MPLELEELRRRIDATPVNHRGRRKYTAALRHEVVAYLKAGIAKGRSQTSMAKELSIHQATFADWLEPGRTSKSATAKRIVARVEMVPEPGKPMPSTNTERDLVLLIRGGHRVEHLTVESLASVLKALG